MNIAWTRWPGFLLGIITPLVCLLAGSCGNGRDLAEAPQPASAHAGLDQVQASGDPLAGLPGLPDADPLAEVDRNLSFTNVVSYNGNGIFDSSPNALFPSNSIVLPSSAADLAWARYAFNTGGYQPERLSVDITCNPGSVAFVGYSDYGTGRWQWEQPIGGPASFDLPEGLYLNSSDQFFVLVLTYGGSVVTLSSLSARFDNDVFYDYSISGTILDEHGTPLASQSILISPNPDNVQLVTDVDGSYIIGLPATGMYNVQPEAGSILYLPASENVDVQGDETAVDFVGTRIDISGRIANSEGIGLPGVSLTLSPGGMTTVSGADGEYRFSGMANGNYTVDPLLAGYSFDPPSGNANVSGADVDGVDFESTGGQPRYSILGNISEANLAAVEGVLIVLSPGYRIAITDSVGNYGFNNLGEATYKLTPFKGQWIFSPAMRQVSLVGSSENNANFTAVPPPPAYELRGQVMWLDTQPPPGTNYGIPDLQVRVEEDSPSRKVLFNDYTGKFGEFSFPEVPDGQYNLSVNGEGYSSEILTSVTINGSWKNVIMIIKLDPGPTWKNFAAIYVGNHCTSCHRPESQTSVAPFLRNYSEVKSSGSACNLRIQNETMPPGNPSLDIHKRYFEIWKDAGYPLE